MMSLRGSSISINGTCRQFTAANPVNLIPSAIISGRRLLLHTSPIQSQAARLPPRLVLKEEDLHEAFVHGSGPGGQKINKTACAVQLKHLPTGLTITSQATRSRTQNRKIARRLLAEKVEVLERGDESRVAVKAAVKGKKKASKTKKARRKYRALSAGKDDDDDDSGGEEEEDGDGEEDAIEKEEGTRGRDEESDGIRGINVKEVVGNQKDAGGHASQRTGGERSS